MRKLSIEELKQWAKENSENGKRADAIRELITLRELKGDQVPVAEIKFHPSTDKHPCMYWFGKQDRDFPVGTQFFTAPQKPVVKLFPPLNPVMFNADVMFGYHKARAEDKAAIEAAGGIVKDGE